MIVQIPLEKCTWNYEFHKCAEQIFASRSRQRIMIASLRKNEAQTMEPTLQHYLTYIRVERGYTENTLAAYRSDLEQFQRFARSRQVERWEQLTPEILQRFTALLRERHYRTATITRKVASVRSFLSFLFAEGILERELVEWLPLPHVGQRLPHPLSKAEMNTLLETTEQDRTPLGLRDSAILELLYATGIRATETVALTLHDVDWEQHIVTCYGKGQRERQIPLHERARASLRLYVEEGRPFLLRDRKEQRLFINRLGHPLSRQGLWYIIRRRAREAGLPEVSPHTLRHTFATHLLDGGAGIREIQHFLGHANVTITQIYTKVTDPHKREVYNRAHPRAFRESSSS